ncbi:MAG: AAA family ATPase [Geobacteraceae bacterium]
MTICEATIQVRSVYPGILGGAFFKGMNVDQRKLLKCKADWRVLPIAPHRGEFWYVKGTLINHPDYGEQLHASESRLVGLPSPDCITALLAKHRFFRGFYLGTVKIGKLACLGDQVLVDLLNNGNSYEISKVVGSIRAERLVDAWSRFQNEVETSNFLMQHKFSFALLRKVLKITRHNTTERLKANPYIMVCFSGLTQNIWKKVDECAKSLSIPKNDPRRLAGIVEHVIYESLRDGHTAITKTNLINRVKKLLKAESYGEASIKYALERKVLICLHSNNSEPIFQGVGPAYIEHSLEKRIKHLLSRVPQIDILTTKDSVTKETIDRYSNELEHSFKYALTKQQKSAVYMALTNRCSLVISYVETDKTPILKAVADVAKRQYRSFFLLTVAYKAKERMRQAIGHPVMTIHGFIKAVEQKYVDINCDPLIVIDEASMVDAALFNRLLKLFDGKPYHLLAVGDTAQLPIGFGMVWHKMAKSSCIPIMELSEVARQGSGSDLYKYAMQVREGYSEDVREWRGETEGFYFVEANRAGVRHALLDIRTTLPEAQILTPHISPSMPDCVDKINRFLQKCLNGGSPGFPLENNRLRIGDPVIITEDNYGLGLFNGTTGRMISLDSRAGELIAGFEFEGHDSLVFLDIEQVHEVGITLAYAISVQKAQCLDSEIVVVSCVVDTEKVERSFIYTGLMRAKRLCIIVGSREVYHKAITKLPRSERLCVGFSI